MQLQIASDLHLEFPENRNYMALNPLQTKGNILLLAGDIIPLKDIDRHGDFFSLLADSYEHTYWVPGNHEYYYFDIANRSGAFRESIRSNVTLLNNSTIELKQVKIHFTTLWSKISKYKAHYIERGMMDFRVIKDEGRWFSVEKYNEMHSDSIVFLETALKVRGDNGNEDVRNIVVSHHVPTFQHYPRQYLDSVLNEAFATDLDALIEDSVADYWIYGHHHDATPEFGIGKTKLLTNQLGYVHQDEHSNFDCGKTITIDA
jgi:predicted phosphohydrolase